MRKSETRKKAYEFDHVTHGEALLSSEREKGKSRTIRKGHTIEPPPFF